MMSEQKKPLAAASATAAASETSEASEVATPPVTVDEQVEEPVEEQIRERVEEQDEKAHHAHWGGDTRVLIHNDDVTPYDYVIDTLNDIFLLSDEMAEHVAWTAHTRGTAVVVVRPRPEAEKLVKAAHSRAKLNGFPLTFSVETDED
jgi:ATP-dependent Clp protease adaptor protein ClpS